MQEKHWRRYRTEVDEKWRDCMKHLQKAMAKIREAMKNAPNEDMKRIWRKHYDAIDKKIIKEELNEKF